MLRSILFVSDLLREDCSECVAEAIIEAIQYKLTNGKNDDFSSVEMDKYILLSILMAYDDHYIKREYDPVANFELSFFNEANKKYNDCEE